MTDPEWIDLPGAPAIPGLAFRRFRGEADLPAMVTLLKASARADGLDYAESVEGVRLLLANLPHFDPARDLLFAQVDGRVVAYSRVWWREEATGEWIYASHGFVDPAWRRRGLGAAMLRHDEDRLRQISAAHPAGPRFFQVAASDGQAGAHALYRAAGYEPVRALVEMVRAINLPLLPAALPAGLEVRPVQEEQIPAVWAAREEVWRDHWGYTPFTAEDYRRWRASPLFEPRLWKVAWGGDEVAGMVLNRINRAENEENRRQRGYTQDVFVRRPWRRRGLARALLTQSIQMFRDLGMEETALGVDSQNPHRALALYESLGYREVRRHTVYRRPMAGPA